MKTKSGFKLKAKHKNYITADRKGIIPLLQVFHVNI